MLRHGRVALLLFVVLSLAGCSLLRGEEGGEEETIVVRIDNQNFYDATVYLRWQSDRRRLGVVVGHTRRTFTTRLRAPTVQIEVQLLAGGGLVGDRVSVGPGDVVDVEVTAQQERLIVRVR